MAKVSLPPDISFRFLLSKPKQKMLLACSVAKALGVEVSANDFSTSQTKTRLSSPPIYQKKN